MPLPRNGESGAQVCGSGGLNYVANGFRRRRQSRAHWMGVDERRSAREATWLDRNEVNNMDGNHPVERALANLSPNDKW